MSKPLQVADEPCSSCPYRKDTPPGVWHESEYEKLRGYDDGPQGQTSFAAFLCHHSTAACQLACRGWLTVHRESVAARLAVMTGVVSDEQRHAAVSVELYANGNEAADAGLAGVTNPSEAAIQVSRKLSKHKRARAKR